MRRFIPSIFTGLRARLVLGFMVVTLISLGLVFAALPRLLDGYFLGQAQQDLNRRTNVAGLFVALQLLDYQVSDQGLAQPILEGDPLAIAPGASEALVNGRTNLVGIASSSLRPTSISRSPPTRTTLIRLPTKRTS